MDQTNAMPLDREGVREVVRHPTVHALGITRYPDAYLYQQLNLIRLEVRRRNFARAKA